MTELVEVDARTQHEARPVELPPVSSPCSPRLFAWRNASNYINGSVLFGAVVFVVALVLVVRGMARLITVIEEPYSAAAQCRAFVEMFPDAECNKGPGYAGPYGRGPASNGTWIPVRDYIARAAK